MKLVLASNNAKKMKELNALLAPLGFEVIPSAANFVFARHPRHDAEKSALALRRMTKKSTGRGQYLRRLT